MIEFKKTKKNDFRFIVKSNSGKTLLKSISFSTEDAMESSLNMLTSKDKFDAKLFERKTNTAGKFLVELKNREGKLIGSSGLYTSEAGMENGILNITQSLMTGLPS
ncbi:MAG: YegP family protein [Maribacter sp.]